MLCESGHHPKNVDEMPKSEDPSIKRFLGIGRRLRQVGRRRRRADARNVIKQVGNYGDSDTRHVGPATPPSTAPERALDQRRLMYAILFR